MTMLCYHCHEPVPDDVSLTVVIDGQARPMCCHGCKAAAELIHQNGLDQFYQLRDAPSPTASEHESKLAALDLPDVQREFVHEDGEDREAELVISGMRCSACAWLIEHILGQCPGVRKAVVNVTAERLVLAWNSQQTQLSTLVAHIGRLGYTATPFHPDVDEANYRRESQDLLIRMGIAALVSMQVMMFAAALWFGAFEGIEAQYKQYLRLTSLLFTLPVMGYSAVPFYRAAVRGVLNRRAGMDLPVSIALILAFSSSVYAIVSGGGEVYFESISMFVFFLLIGRYLEHRARRRAMEHAANLRRSMPLMARRRRDDGTVEEVAAASVQLGDRLLVAPGETLPADGTICDGEGDINESMLTGESVPVAKSPGASVYAGTLNGISPLEIRVSKRRADSVLATLMRSQTLALAQRPHWANLADRLAHTIVIAILVIAAVAYGIWYVIDPSRAFGIFLAVLVVTCPCALALATPTALSCAIARLGELGVMVRRSSALEPLSHVTDIVFDKTGTLTTGELALRSTVSMSGLSAEQALAIAAALESNSEHVLARAFRTATESSSFPTLRAESVNNQPGYGVTGDINGTSYSLGRPDWHGGTPDGRESCVQVTLFAGREPVAHFYLHDELRRDAVTVIDALKQRGNRISVLSGDPSTTASAILAPLSLSDIRTGLSPDEKQRRICEIQARHGCVLAVGDGINDAPTLAQADCSIAMGGATDLAKQSADAVLIGSQLQPMLAVLTVALKTRWIVRENLLWAALYNAVVIPLAIAGHITPYYAALGMSVSSLLVLINASRLMRVS